MASAPASRVRDALAGERAWLVGGAVRDRLLGRATDDLDVALQGDPAAAARRLRRVTGGAAFPLSDTFGGWRVAAPDFHVDLLPLTGGSLEADLAARDLTINAMAEPLDGGALVDPHGGQADLAARRLRMVAPGAFASDPLRVLRTVRLAAELGFAIEDATLAAARAHAPGLDGVAAERVWAELKRIVCAPDPVAAVRLLQDVAPLFDRPDYERLARVAQLALDEPLADGLTRAQGLRFAALVAGADRLRAWRAAEKVVRQVETVLRAAPPDPADRRAVFRFLKATAPFSADAALLHGAPALLDAPPLPGAPLVRGDALAAALGIPAGPRLGALLARLEEDRYAGEIATADEAIARARTYL